MLQHERRVLPSYRQVDHMENRGLGKGGGGGALDKWPAPLDVAIENGRVPPVLPRIAYPVNLFGDGVLSAV